MRNSTAAALAAGTIFGSITGLVVIKERFLGYGSVGQEKPAEGEAGIYAEAFEEEHGGVPSDILRLLEEIGEIEVPPTAEINAEI